MALRDKEGEQQYTVRPAFLKNPATGKVFVTTDALLARGDLVPADNPNKAAAPAPFDYKKATKVQIVKKAKELFDFELDPTSDLKELRSEFKRLQEKQVAEAGE